MLQQLLEDMQVIQQQGAGYYSCIPLIRRYNKLLGQARTLVSNDNQLIDTFDALVEEDPKDPADKIKIVQAIRIEIGQLMALLKAAEEGETS
jgi:hypothetical protein